MKNAIAKSICLICLVFSYSILKEVRASERNGGPVKVSFTKLVGFTLKPEAEPKTGYFTQLFARKVQFDQHFVGSQGKTSSQINFDKYVVLACATPKSKLETNMSLEKILKSNGVLEVYFVKIVGKKPEIKKSIPQAMYTIALDNSYSSIKYFVDGKLVWDLQN
jgi:hypothetical protein